MSTNLKDFLRDNPVRGEFTPYVWLSERADALTVYLDGVPDYSEQVSASVTLFRSLDTKEPVGCRLKGIYGVLRDLPLFVPYGDSVELSLVLLAYRGGLVRNAAAALNALARLSREKKMRVER